MRSCFSITLLFAFPWQSVIGFSAKNPRQLNIKKDDLVNRQPVSLILKDNASSRRNVIATLPSISFAMLTLWKDPATAVEASKPQEFVNVGTQAPPPDGDAPFITLSNGVKIKDFRVGSGDGAVVADSRVSIQCSGRLLNLNGVIFYNTKNNNPDGFGAVPLSIDLGKGQAVPGLEAGLIGMKKGGIRRIIVPQALAYSANPDLEPKPMNTNDQRALDSVVKNPRRDGSILFDVQLERFK